MKRIPLLALVLAAAVLLAGCGIFDSGIEDWQATYTRYTLPTSEADTPTSSHRTVTTADRTTASTTSTTTTTRVTTKTTTKPSTRRTTKSTTPDPVTVCTLEQVSNLLNAAKEADRMEVNFEYMGDTDELTAARMAQMTNACYLSWRSAGRVYTVTMTEYPGDRIVDAHIRGDTASLNAAEQAAYREALAIVNRAKQQASTLYDLELALHDELVRRITYQSDLNRIDDPLNPPRPLTVVGALLDGRANCQGYTDAFYTLASLAGFTVGRLSVKQDGEEHMLNTIQLNGRRYLVDVTHNDCAENSPQERPVYLLFNAGKDMAGHLRWGGEMEYHLIADKSDGTLFYNLPNSAFSDRSRHYQKTFKTLESMANAIVAEWAQNGRTEFYMMLDNEVRTWRELETYLLFALKDVNRACRYHIWYTDNRRDTFYYVSLQ